MTYSNIKAEMKPITHEDGSLSELKLTHVNLFDLLQESLPPF